MALKEFLRPTRLKVVISLALPFVWLLIYIFILFAAKNPNFETLQAFIGYKLLLQAIYYYPVACYIAKIVESRTEDEGYRERLRKSVTFLLLLILLNPVSFSGLSYTLNYLLRSDTTSLPCGVTILDVYNNSPAQKSGLPVNETILLVNGDNYSSYIRNVDDLKDVLEHHNPGNKLQIITNVKPYNLTLGTDPSRWTAYLGVNVTSRYCDCGNGLCEVGETFTLHPSNDSYTRCPSDCK